MDVRSGNGFEREIKADWKKRLVKDMAKSEDKAWIVEEASYMFED